jgi:hypothetical protein
MEFGLLPEFSTPVEKPVENAGFALSVRLKAMFHDTFSRRRSAKHGLKPFFEGLATFSHALGRRAEAKVRRSR